MTNNPALEVIIGLGNEGEEYQKTYHNVGSFVTSFLKEKQASEGGIRFIDKVGGYMNVIGGPIKKMVAKTGINPEHLLIVHDETDLPIGEYRISLGGGSAGHKGVASVIDHLGTEQFWRLRIGVRDPKEQVRRKAEEFVLSHWSKADELFFVEVASQAMEELKQKQLL